MSNVVARAGASPDPRVEGRWPHTIFWFVSQILISGNAAAAAEILVAALAATPVSPTTYDELGSRILRALQRERCGPDILLLAGTALTLARGPSTGAARREAPRG